ncbi:uncharacterized protein RCO7_03975 [Rhynchosporium graminicola]|uniref:BZIP domain-containing protein n=1 Tax=Rhynchosporium graminicola TaxID=2792576 RepID=A0A1E1L5X8_9HELO|nr:uncharacterized protein RCO7_03975 [Rhynchosporium commune]
MTQAMNIYNDYLVFSTSQLHDSYTNIPEDQYADNYYPSPVPYQINGDSDWMSSASSPASYTAPDYSSSSYDVMPTPNDSFTSSWHVGTNDISPSQSAKELQKLNRRRQQNRESQRAFRQRKNKDLEHLERALSDLQEKHDKLLMCFVGLTAKISAERLGGLVGDVSFLDEQIKQYNSCLGKDFKMNGDRREVIRAKTKHI